MIPFVKSEDLIYFCRCATTSGNIDLVNAKKCVFTADKKVVKTHFFFYEGKETDGNKKKKIEII